jgi:hypothetical protein
MWLSGRASPCQGEGREFESRHPLQETALRGGFSRLCPGVDQEDEIRAHLSVDQLDRSMCSQAKEWPNQESEKEHRLKIRKL